LQTSIHRYAIEKGLEFLEKMSVGAARGVSTNGRAMNFGRSAEEASA
jgi:hypothetical protein